MTRNSNGSFTQTGTITGPNGKTVGVDREVKPNSPDGRSVTTTYTDERGDTLKVDKTIEHHDGNRDVVGHYETSNGRSGTFESHGGVAKQDNNDSSH